MYRVQKKVTVTKEQEDFIRVNHGSMTIGAISKMLGLGFTKTHKNMVVMGLAKHRKAPVIKMDNCFDVDEFGKYYNY